MAIQAGLDGDVLLSASPSIALGAVELSTDSGDHIHYTMVTHKYWDRAFTVVVEQSPNGSSAWTTVPTSEYTFQYCGGKITFTPARVVATNNFIRITTAAHYYNVSSVSDCNEWSLDIGGDTEDTTPFQASGGWRQNTPTVKKASAKVSGFKPDDTFSGQLNGLVILVLYSDKSAGTRWEMYAYLVGVGKKVSATGLVTDETSFTVDSEPFFSAT